MDILRLLRVFFAIVAAVAGVAGVVMLVAPDRTDDYFSWAIGPPPVAALVGGFYVASAVVFGLAALRVDWPAVRGLCVGVLALTVPTLIATARHDEVFDFGRVQALAWVALFVASPCAYGTVLYLQRGRVVDADGPRLARWARFLAAILGAAYVALAAGAWIDPSGLEQHAPFALRALSGAFIGCWAFFLGVLALFAAWRPSVRETRLPLLAVTLWPTAGVIAALLRFDDLLSGRRVVYTVALAVLAAMGVVLLIAGRERTQHGAEVRP